MGALVRRLELGAWRRVAELFDCGRGDSRSAAEGSLFEAVVRRFGF